MLLRDDILSRALELSPSDRAYVVDRLEESLAHSVVDPSHDAVAGEEFAAELQRRSAAYRSGQMTVRSAAEVMAELRQRQADETRP